MSRVIGITGTIGSGKSTVGNILRDLNIPVIDTDHVVHQLLSESGLTRQLVADRFGASVVAADGSIDRIALGKVVFSDLKARKDLEAIVHPAVGIEMKRLIAGYLTYPVVAVLVPLLFEAGLERSFHEVWAITTKEKILQERLKSRDGLSDEQIKQRLAAQMPQYQKAARSHHVIDNSGSIESTRQQIKRLLEN